jgi:ubiquinone/menaquinone biosynthesis C-methylase UbiE
VLWADDQSSRPEVPGYASDMVRIYPLTQFNQALVPLKLGRFYPSRILDTSEPLPGPLLRIVQLGAKRFTADFNHPVAGQDCSFSWETLVELPALTGNAISLLDWAGIDTPLRDGEVDYSDAEALSRDDEDPDPDFYTTPRKLMHVDGVCSARMAAFYRKHLHDGDKVLDLMAAWQSHLGDFAGEVTGLGMNAEEMEDNSALKSFAVHDLNDEPRLPFDDDTFDAVINTVSIEYLVQTRAVLADVYRVLKPGGKLLITFSNRFFPSKTIRLWKLLHPVERLNWVAQMVHTAGFTGIETRVERGLERDSHDPYYPQMKEMDPVFGVVGRKSI